MDEEILNTEYQEPVSDPEEEQRPVSEEVSEEPAEKPEVEQTPSRIKSGALISMYDLMGDLATALIVVTFLFALAFRMVVVDGDSMNNTLTNGDRLIMQSVAYTPDRGDIVVIYQEDTKAEPLIKRVIGIGGDSLKLDVQNNAVYLKNAGENEWQLLEEPYIEYPLEWGIMWADENGNGENDEVTIPDGYVFVLGDHRNNSKDSRMIGLVSVKDIVGHAMFRVLPFQDFGKV